MSVQLNNKNYNNKRMKINIPFNFVDGPSGGGNQFLKALRDELIVRNMYTDSFIDADVVLYNSHHNLHKVVEIYKLNTRKIFIHRLGPIFSLHRGYGWKMYDRAIIALSNALSDGVVFQSLWSKKESIGIGFSAKIPSQIIYNSADAVFSRDKHCNKVSSPIELITTSNSKNKNKGFRYLTYLDQHLDTSRYHMIFVGNTPVTFKTIKIIRPVGPKELSKILKKADIYIAPFADEACSNAILEALASGLPVCALKSASNPEIIKKGGNFFSDEVELLTKIDQLASNYLEYQSKIQTPSISEITDKYITFINGILVSKRRTKNRTSITVSLLMLKFSRLLTIVN